MKQSEKGLSSSCKAPRNCVSYTGRCTLPSSALRHHNGLTALLKLSLNILLLHLMNIIFLVSLIVILSVIFPWFDIFSGSIKSFQRNQTFVSRSKWRDYTLFEAAAFVAKNGTVIVCAVSQPFLPFLSNWLISVSRQKHQNKVLVIAEDYATLYKVNQKWPGHAVLIPPAPEAQTLHNFGSQGFFNFTARRPHHLLQILELGYNVMYNDADMIWVADPFPYLQEHHDIYFTDDVHFIKNEVKPSDLPSPIKKSRNNFCSCMIFLRPTSGAKQVIKKWIEEMQVLARSKNSKLHDQVGFNLALEKIAGQVDAYLLPQSAFPPGCLYFKNQTWVPKTKGSPVIIHNNYLKGFDNKLKRFRDYGLWLVDDHSLESPLEIEGEQQFRNNAAIRVVFIPIHIYIWEIAADAEFTNAKHKHFISFVQEQKVILMVTPPKTLTTTFKIFINGLFSRS